MLISLSLAMSERLQSTDVGGNASSSETTPMLSPSTNYIIQIPKDQILHKPPPENAHKYGLYTKRGQRKRRHVCCCYLLLSLILLVIAIGVTVGILYLVFRPKLPSYSIESLFIKGFNNVSSSTVSPELDIGVRAENPNEQIDIYYRPKSSISVVYSGVHLCSGKWPVFTHKRRNTTTLQMVLTGPEIELSDSTSSELATQEKNGAIPLNIYLRIPVRVKLGSMMTWTFTVKGLCDIKVNGLNKNAKIVAKSSRCNVHRVNIFS